MGEDGVELEVEEEDRVEVEVEVEEESIEVLWGKKGEEEEGKFDFLLCLGWCSKKNMGGRKQFHNCLLSFTYKIKYGLNMFLVLQV